MKRFRIDPAARRDIKDIYVYISRDNPSAAARQVAVFYDKFTRLSASPLLGAGLVTFPYCVDTRVL
jgi:plasmid stabilization system protein ParE